MVKKLTTQDISTNDAGAAKLSGLQIFPSLPLRDMIIYPFNTTTILVGRHKSLESVEEAKKADLPIFAIGQIHPDTDDFVEGNLFASGTLCKIIESIKTPDGSMKVILQGVVRADLVEIVDNRQSFLCAVDILAEESKATDNKELLGLIKACIESFTKYSAYNKRITADVLSLITKVRSPEEIVYLMASYVNGVMRDKHKILSEKTITKKLYKLLELLRVEIEIGQAEERITKSIQEKFSKHQKEIYLNEQLKNIKKELGQDEEGEFEELKEKLSKLKLPTEVKKKSESELKKLEKMNPYASEAGVVRNYLDWIVNLPWSKKTSLLSDLSKAQKVLDKYHYGLQNIKDRILEFIAVQIKTKDSKGPILCLVGAPGVGKTSLAKSIAESLGRQYVKVSLGGVKDESEIRGHRKTYIGAMPGRIIQSMKKAGSINPMMLLDEIDKMSSDFRGDPAAALLEVLDPEQNHNFSDHYLEVDYDLSKVMFVATANSLSTIPIPLRDRMEIINLSGYTENEKLHIAKEHLLPKQRKENGLSSKEFKIDDNAFLTLIRKYTFEAGVRNLNREIAKLARKAVRDIITKKKKSVTITEKNLKDYAGIEKKQFGVAKKKDMIGVATGLAYTEYGGDLLDIEVLKFEGAGKVLTTGRLGDVMKESASAALSYVRSVAQDLKVDAKKFNKFDFHIHVPAGATPKDGPSAGVALAVCLASIVSNKKIRKDIAMTGELTLSGKVLEIGGLKEKLLAALRGKIKIVLIPEENKKDLEEMPKEVLDQLTIKPISHVEEAIKECLI
ncbi:MAG: endopeptidase La [Rickettsiales bacterium]|nr:endopeptidase La [Rickettsiales bacterium]